MQAGNAFSSRRIWPLNILQTCIKFPDPPISHLKLTLLPSLKLKHGHHHVLIKRVNGVVYLCECVRVRLPACSGCGSCCRLRVTGWTRPRMTWTIPGLSDWSKTPNSADSEQELHLLPPGVCVESLHPPTQTTCLRTCTALSTKEKKKTIMSTIVFTACHKIGENLMRFFFFFLKSKTAGGSDCNWVINWTAFGVSARAHGQECT